MLFENASAPTSWTKDITYADRALRIVNGTASFGGSNEFSSILASSRSVSGTVSSVQSGTTINTAPAGLTINPGTYGPFSTSLNATSGASHTHAYNNLGENFRVPGGAVRESRVVNQSLSVGSGQQHAHTIPVSPHTHTFTNPTHTHTLTEANHGHPFTSTAQNFAVSYRDVILATKD